MNIEQWRADLYHSAHFYSGISLDELDYLTDGELLMFATLVELEFMDWALHAELAVVLPFQVRA